MKKIGLIITGALALGLLSGPTALAEDMPSTGPTDKADRQKDIEVVAGDEFLHRMSYALGYDIFRHISGQVDLDTQAFLEGIRDAGKGDPKLGPEEMRQLLASYQRLARKAETEKIRKVRDKNLADGAVFMEGNKLKEGVVSLSSGLQYKVLRQGDGPVPKPEDTVECHYRGTFIDGTEFDSSFKRGRPAVFQVSRVIAGWTQALTRMPVGAKWELYVPADLAYGDEGAGERILPGQTLVFVVELLGILEYGAKE